MLLVPLDLAEGNGAGLPPVILALLDATLGGGGLLLGGGLG